MDQPLLEPAFSQPRRRGVAMSDAVAVPECTPLVGVRGWLLFLCISLVFFVPVLAVADLITPFRSDIITSDHRVLDVFIFGSVPAAVSIVLSIAAGISLWTVRPYAIRLTYAFMVFAVVSECILAPLIYTANFDLDYSDTIDGTAMARMFIYIAIWATYLARSERVHNTFRAAKPKAG
jgi:hypothetical protein